VPSVVPEHPSGRTCEAIHLQPSASRKVYIKLYIRRRKPCGINESVYIQGVP
jgi:hypothetical protein